jgi:hypothetical protein
MAEALHLCYLDPHDARWAETFWKALKPQGLLPSRMQRTVMLVARKE